MTHGEPGSAVPLARDERREARARAAVKAKIVHEAIPREGEEELARPSAARREG